ncbi:hypothetical protein C4561_01550 [candidate division WWE3 bacterium]|uniref:Carboxypeptidase regulatory-like domain-containing protein n=1 Tax=candidate division WWE3 bacterium TaxID=2053526 RepID=A0A3A4ZFG6_UNCKA|nr:MAG: hypothetical protein C4561_01550 [candidate division WWE3 bacterium]
MKTKVVQLLIIVILTSSLLIAANRTVPVGGCYTQNYLSAVADSVKVVATDSASLNDTISLAWTSSCYSGKITVDADGDYVSLEYLIYDDDTVFQSSETIYFSTTVDDDSSLLDFVRNSGTWTSAEADSVLSAVRDDVMAKKIWNIAFSTGFTAGSMGDSLTNWTYVQGQAAGITADAIVEAWANRYLSDFADAADFDSTFAGALHRAGQVSLRGNRTLTLTFYDSVSSEVIPFTSATIKNYNGTANLWYFKTDASGVEATTLPADSYKVYPYQYQVTFPSSYYTFNIDSGNVNDTINASPLASSPYDPQHATITARGYIFRPNLVNKNGVLVRARISKENVKLTRGNIPISPIWVTDTTDTNGYFEFNLYVSDSLTPRTPWTIEAIDSLEKPFKTTTVYTPVTSPYDIEWR